jgi:hypothetical protein
MYWRAGIASSAVIASRQSGGQLFAGSALFNRDSGFDWDVHCAGFCSFAGAPWSAHLLPRAVPTTPSAITAAITAMTTVMPSLWCRFTLGAFSDLVPSAQHGEAPLRNKAKGQKSGGAGDHVSLFIKPEKHKSADA